MVAPGIFAKPTDFRDLRAVPSGHLLVESKQVNACKIIVS